MALDIGKLIKADLQLAVVNELQAIQPQLQELKALIASKPDQLTLVLKARAILAEVTADQPAALQSFGAQQLQIFNAVLDLAQQGLPSSPDAALANVLSLITPAAAAAAKTG